MIASGSVEAVFTIMVIAALGWVAYKFFRFNTTLGTEAVRAYYYLEACLSGEGPLNANRYAHFSISGGEPASVQRVINDIRTVHGGKQGPLIAEAYRRGLFPMLPSWYQKAVSNAPITPAIETIYHVPLSSAKAE